MASTDSRHPQNNVVPYCMIM